MSDNPNNHYQSVVDALAEATKLSPTEIGIRETQETVWKIFYDMDDLLAFPTSFLFDIRSATVIQDIPVNSHEFPPNKAHIAYWKNIKVHKAVAELLHNKDWVVNLTTRRMIENLPPSMKVLVLVASVTRGAIC
ncbi:MAG TPA: hypothetical protein V6D14_24180 [Coleofasciculaceae cyanobacterium]|jgi:hypothetical protein